MKHKEIFAIGSYTQVLDHVPQGCGEGIYLVELDLQTGIVKLLNTFNGIKNPSYLNWDSISSTLYAVSEGGKDNPVLFQIDIKDQKMTVLNSIVENSSSPCHITKYKESIITASYQYGSTTVFDTSKGLNLVKVTSYSGSGPNKQRQDAPHAHQVVLNTEMGIYYVSDLGSDKIWIHNLESNQIIGSVDTPPGFGPRHLVIKNNELYVLCELEPKLLHYKAISKVEYKLEKVCSLYIESEYNGRTAPAAIKIDPSSENIYCANRFKDKISIFNINNSENTPQFITEIDCYGKTPRDFTFSSNGQWLIILNQDSSNIVTIELDPQTGLPITENINNLEIKTPVCAVSIG